MKTGIIISVYNRSAALATCLKALAAAPHTIDEVVVSDDGSDTAHTAAMQALFPSLPFPVRYTRQEHAGYRLAAARNNAIRASSADYIVSIDCDILLLPGTLEAHRRHARRGMFLAGNRALLDRAAATTLMQSACTSQDLETAWHKSDRRHLARAHRAFLRNQLLRRLRLAQRHKPKILGCHFSLFREDIENINGFDENFVGWGLEDDDFALRLHLAGIKGRSLIMRARAMHLWHPAADSKPASLSATPNAGYFRRRNITARCSRGLRSHGGHDASEPGSAASACSAAAAGGPLETSTCAGRSK